MPLRLLRKKTHTFAFILLGIALVAVGIVWYNQQPSMAADLSKFDPGNIMSDAVMSNKNSMTEAQIQAFLESKNPCNNTNTHMASWYPNLQYNIRDGKFVCMAKESFNGESASHIIWQAGQDYGINPQVLIVLLQKEQGLITDTWPNHVQYRGATGYGCPDTAPCDEQYYGLKNQIRKSAELFRTVLNGGWSNYPVGNNYVQYNPNTACGGSVINIQNRATSALYRYTPYQPNQSALNAGYGTGDGCGAYGNRNFWAYFTDWFGSTQGNRWETLVDPRIMTVNENMFKYNVNTHLPDKLPLHTGQQIKFVSKTKLPDSTTCLRTAIDTANNNPLCIPLSKLSELTITYEQSDELRAIDQFTCPVDVRRSEARCDKKTIEINQQFKVSATTKVRGVDYYVIGTDLTTNSNPLGIRADRTRASYKYTDITPVYLRTNRMTNMISHIDSRRLDKPINPGKIILLSQKVTVNNITYYRTSQDAHLNIDRVVLGERLSPIFDAFLTPRNLKTIRQAKSENLITGEVCATVNANSTLFFSSKSQINGNLYFRTGNMTAIDSMCAIKATSLGEL